MFNGMDNLDANKFLQSTNAPTRGHSLKLVKHGCNLDIRKFSFPHRITQTLGTAWLSIIFACESVNSFKVKLDPMTLPAAAALP
jgi:hypothetical protein